jgi:hypothetical protein
MGIDIYLYAELKENGGWTPVPSPVKNEYSDDHELVPCEVLDLGRPYGLFSVLSGGSVGLRCANDQIPAISKSRGFPDDMNDFYQDYVAERLENVSGVYGASWLMLSELIDFDWDQKVKRVAYVKRKYAKLFHKNEPFPAHFPKEQELYHGLFKDPPEKTEKVHWCVSVADYIGDSHKHLIKALNRLGSRERLRMIYWFSC